MKNLSALMMVMVALANAKSTEYNLVFDCGSSGTRIYMYQQYQPAVPPTHKRVLDTPYEYRNINELKTKPGISSFEYPDAAARSLDPLIDQAALWMSELNLTNTQVSCFLGATAGVRVWKPEDREATIDALRERIVSSDLCQVSPNAIRILSGEEEAIFAWASAQYLSELHESKPIGIIEMGGASTQIAARPRYESDVLANLFPVSVQPDDTKRIYGQSFLRFGANEYQKRFLEYLLMQNAHGDVVENPCWPSSYKSITTVGKYAVTMIGTSDIEECEYQTEQFVGRHLAPSIPCVEGSQQRDSCTLLGRYIPEGISQLTDYVLLDKFYENWDFFQNLEQDNVSTLSQLREQYAKLCTLPLEEFEAYAIKESTPLEDAVSRCSFVSYFYTLLTKAHHVRPDQKLTIAEKINDVSATWTLGMVMVGANL